MWDAFTDDVRAIEREITAHDEAIVMLKLELKTRRDAREQAIAQLRARIRDPLPLFAGAEVDDARPAASGE